jgi:hypothetical protein
MWKQKKRSRVKRRNWSQHLKDLDFFFQKILIIFFFFCDKNEGCIRATSLIISMHTKSPPNKTGVWNYQILNLVVKNLWYSCIDCRFFTSLSSRFQQWLYSDFELHQISAFLASESDISPCFTAGERIGIWDCYATWRHWETGHFLIYIVHAWLGQVSLAQLDSHLFHS